MADAKEHLSVIPTEYDEDGPMPPIQEALLTINRAKEVDLPTSLFGTEHQEIAGVHCACSFVLRTNMPPFAV